MKTNEINIIDLDENTNSIFKFTEEVSNGLYISSKENEVAHNLKTFNIVKNHHTPKDQVGVQYSKKGDYLIISFFINDKSRVVVVQVLVVKGITKDYVLNCDNQTIKYFTPQIMDGIDLLDCITFADFEKLNRFKK